MVHYHGIPPWLKSLILLFRWLAGWVSVVQSEPTLQKPSELTTCGFWVETPTSLSRRTSLSKGSWIVMSRYDFLLLPLIIENVQNLFCLTCKPSACDLFVDLPAWGPKSVSRVNWPPKLEHRVARLRQVFHLQSLGCCPSPSLLDRLSY